MSNQDLSKKTEKKITLSLAEARAIRGLCDACGLSPSCFYDMRKVFVLLIKDQCTAKQDSLLSDCMNFLKRAVNQADVKANRCSELLRVINNLKRFLTRIDKGFDHLDQIDQAAHTIGKLIREKFHALGYQDEKRRPSD